MAELSEAFNGLEFQNKKFKNIDHFFTQRNVKEDHEYLDKNMNRLNKKVNIIYNFLAISIPNPIINTNKESVFEVLIYGDSGYHYKGNITSYQGNIPNFMIPLKKDKKIFIHIKYQEINNSDISDLNEYISFIEVPKRFQIINNEKFSDNINDNIESDTI